MHPINQNQISTLNNQQNQDDSFWSKQALKKFDDAKEEDFVRESLKNSNLDCLSKAKKSITEARKNKMRIVEHYLCDNCDRVIDKPCQGFVIQGNIFVADPKVKGGLVGNNLPDPDEKNMIDINAIKQTVLCQGCLCQALGFVAQSQDSWDVKKYSKHNYNTKYRNYSR